MKYILTLIILLPFLNTVRGQILKKPIPDKLVVLTFDDAPVTHATVVAPLLKKYGFGGTFFVCEFPPDYADTSLYMTWEQIKALDNMGFEVANHTGSHTQVNTVDKSRIIRELEYIEDRCAQHGISRPSTFAYPAYFIHPMALEVLEEKNYNFARIGGGRPYDPFGDHPYLIPSFSTTGTDSIRVLDAIRQAQNGKIVVLTVHGVPDYAHDWVTTPPVYFEKYLEFLAENDYQVISLKELTEYIDPVFARKSLGAKMVNPDGTPIIQADVRHFSSDLSRTVGPMDPVYAWFGYDEPNYTYMKDGRKLLSELADLSPVPVYVRTHNLLTSGDGLPALKWGSTNAYTEDAEGNSVYNWQIIDSIVDTYIERGMKPLMEIGFMPAALSSHPDPYRHSWTPENHYSTIFTGWAYPPKDYGKWSELVYQWVLHSVDRYGKEEVESWLWELWNEPNIGYWQGSLEEYIKLYDYTADAVKRALPGARMGGPHTTGPAWDKAEMFLRAFLEHCINGTNSVTGEKGSPLDFIAFHAKGGPEFIDGRVVMNLGKQLRDISKGFEIVASYPALKHLPIVIGESDPEGCAACSMDVYPHNGYRNGTMYPSYSAAAFPRKIALADHFKVNFEGAVTWAFEFEDQPWFHGFRDLATNGVDKPVLNVFRMFGLMQGDRVAVEGDWVYDFRSARDSSIRKGADVGVFATKDNHTAAFMVWHYHDVDEKGEEIPVELMIKEIPSDQVQMEHFRIDEFHSNSYSVWKKMNSPQYPSAQEYTALERAGKLDLLDSPGWLKLTDGKLKLDLIMPRHSVSLIKLRW